MLKQSTAALYSTSTLPLLVTPTPPSRAAGIRTYATARRDVDNENAPAWPRSSHPTPYEILGLRRDARYTKHRFHRLVKLYHPDTNDHDHSPSNARSPSSKRTVLSKLSSSVRLERYRLVVAANDLLSDPNKRYIYDTQGLGWNEGFRSPSLRDTDRAWRFDPNNAFHNATWEDWERWREARDGRPREPLYMSNGLFATLVVMMCMVGGLAQANRAEPSGAQYIDETQQRHAAIGHDIQHSHTISARRSRDDRVNTFLRDREPLMYDPASENSFESPQPPARPA